MLGSIRGEIRFKEPLSFHSSLRLGGPADIMVLAHDPDDVRHALRYAEREKLPVTVIGGGNNLLIRERGIRGLVLKLDGPLQRVELYGEEAVAGAAASLPALIREAAAVDLGGLEGFAGIPATVGGALAADLRSEGRALADLVSAVYFLRGDGALEELKPGAGFLPAAPLSLPSDAVVVGCRMRLQRRPRAEIQRDLNRRLKLRKRTEPMALASAVVWKDTASASAACLVEKVGLKGKRLNGAEISAKNPNFIVNRSGATATDVLALMDLTRERVQRQFAIILTEAIQVIGE
jgi:UDP-N-acetylmuramate dehydrogenase